MIKHKKIAIIFSVIVLTIFIGTSFAWYIFNTGQSSTNAIITDCFEVTYTDRNYISLDNAIPMKDENYTKLVPYEFSVKNICNTAVSFDIALEKINTSTMDEAYLRYKLNDDEISTIGSREISSNIKNSDAISSHIIGSSILFGGQTKSYNLRIWIDYNSTKEQSANKTYSSKVVVTSTVNKESYRDIAFNLNGGTLDDNVYHYIDGKTYDLLPSPTKEGYVFGGWYKDSELTDKVVESDIVSEDVAQLYAKWIDENFTVTFDYNYLENDIFDQYWQRNKYGYLTAKDNSFSKYFDQLGVSYHIDFTAKDNNYGYHGAYFVRVSDIDLLENNKYTFQFDARASKAVTMLVGPEQSMSGDRQFNLTTEWQHYTTTITAVKHTFNAFVFYTKNLEVDEKFNMDVRNIYINEGNSLNITTATKKYNTELGETPAIPSREGYRFVGWYDDPINGNRADSNTIIPFREDGNFKVYARWLLV